MKKTFVKAALATLCLMSASAFATTMSMTGGLSSGLLADKSYSGSFSGVSFLPVDYVVNSLSFSFSFKDNVGDTFSSNTFETSRVYGDYVKTRNGLFTDDYTRNVTVNKTEQKTGEQESAALYFGSYLAGSGATEKTTSVSGPVTTDGGKSSAYCGDWACWDAYYSKYTNVTTTITTDWTGAFTIAGTITNQALIAQILKNDVVGFKLNVAGDLLLTGSSVQLDFTKVPEPSTLLLGLVGVGGLAFSRRRAKRN